MSQTSFDLKLKKSFDEEEKAIHLGRVKIATLYLATPLVLAFSAVDYFYRPELLQEFFLVRLSVIPVCIIAMLMLRSKIIIEKYYFVPAHFVTMFLGIYSSYLIYRTGLETSGYYVGLNLVAIGSLSWLPFSMTQLLVSFFTIYSPYFFVLAFSAKTLDLSYFIPNTAFIFSTAFIGCVTNILTNKLRYKEIESRLLLAEELESKDLIIQRKTKEGIYLEKLMSQFSPQVIEAIKVGHISIDKRIRREIACIFIDIVSSTERSIKLDHNQYTEIISDFFRETVDVLLKHNITIGTYLGDGLMAFTNAPQPSDNYIENSVRACIEVLKMCERRKKYYREKWQTDFQIKIGINVGFSYVGFFPSQSRGAYTAIGPAVNLASRLCSHASPNTILVTKKVALGIPSRLSDVSMTRVNLANPIKGFEGESIDLFSLSVDVVGAQEALQTCPLCEGMLMVVSDFKATSLVKCVKCGYTDIRDNVEDLSKSA